MNSEAITIKKRKVLKKLLYKTFSVRMDENTFDEITRISEQSNLSRNEIINIFLKHCIRNYRFEE